ncbi:hypothetical protein [Streptomyces sp. SAS_281]|uniref:hypothetical protein n=1 Tax=Streptomyces sp. SAS_281 TaxID=3412744 RepID=UPI00403C2852
MTCRRRLAAWNEAGVWDRLHLVLPKKLRLAQQLDWSRAVIGISHVRAARRDDIHEAFLGLATCLITHRHVQRLCRDLLAW